MGKGSQRKSCALESNTIFRSGNCMSISPVIKIARDQGTLMINDLFLQTEDMSYRIWPSWEIVMKYSLAERILKAWAKIGQLILYFFMLWICYVIWLQLLAPIFRSTQYMEVALTQPGAATLLSHSQHRQECRLRSYTKLTAAGRTRPSTQLF